MYGANLVLPEPFEGDEDIVVGNFMISSYATGSWGGIINVFLYHSLVVAYNLFPGVSCCVIKYPTKLVEHTKINSLEQSSLPMYCDSILICIFSCINCILGNWFQGFVQHISSALPLCHDSIILGLDSSFFEQKFKISHHPIEKGFPSLSWVNRVLFTWILTEFDFVSWSILLISL